MSIRRHFSSALILGALLLVFLPQSLVGVAIFDEGFILSGAMLVLDGKVPYRDFLSMYGPGQFYTTAAIFSVFGESLIVARVLHVFLLAVLGLTIFHLSKKLTKSPDLPWVLLLIYISAALFLHPNVGYPAITSTLLLLFSGVAVFYWVDSFNIAKLVFASFLVGFSAIFRWDFGAFGLVALVISSLAVFMSGAKANDWKDGLRVFVSASVPAFVIIVFIYIPLLVVLSDPTRWFNEVVVFSLREFSSWRGLEYFKPIYWNLMNDKASRFGEGVLMACLVGGPVVFAALTVCPTVFRLARNEVEQREKPALIVGLYVALLCLLLLNQMRVRPTFVQGFPALVASLPLMALVWERYRNEILENVVLRRGGYSISFFICAILFGGALQSVLDSKKSGLVALRTERAAWIRVDSQASGYDDLINYIKNKTKETDFIYSGVQDHSRLFVNDCILYFLTGRQPADRFLELEPGIANTRKGQEEIIYSIINRNVKLVVLVDILSNEKNKTSISNGEYILDDYIKANYRLDQSFGRYKVYLKK